MKNQIKIYLIIGLFVLGLGGLWLHHNVHSPAKVAYGYVPFISGLLSVILIPILFIFRRTLHLAYLLNGFTVIIGVIAMSYLSLAVRPIWPDVIMLIAKFFLGRAIFSLEVYKLDVAPKITGWRLIRYPNMGFWYVHFVLLTAVFALGRILWR
jgi:hypothetical protein